MENLSYLPRLISFFGAMLVILSAFFPWFKVGVPHTNSYVEFGPYHQCSQRDGNTECTYFSPELPSKTTTKAGFLTFIHIFFSLAIIVGLLLMGVIIFVTFFGTGDNRSIVQKLRYQLLNINFVATFMTMIPLIAMSGLLWTDINEFIKREGRFAEGFFINFAGFAFLFFRSLLM